MTAGAPGTRRRRPWRWRLGAVVAVVALSGCSSVGYYAQAIDGHLDLVRRARPVDDWLGHPDTPADLRERLRLAQRMRAFATDVLALPDNRSYRSYVQLDRPVAVWNVVAAPELSLTLHTWCYPVLGCAGYRGYFDRGDAEVLAGELRARGLEVDVYGVPAYSTLGWTEWLGGDPLLSSFIRWPENELARLLFHELAHQMAYASGDTAFNESYATAVERLGVARWREQRGLDSAADLALESRRRDFRELTSRTRAALVALYRSDADDDAKRRRKAEIYGDMRAELERLKRERWGGYAGYDAWAMRANNATLGVQAAYDDLVPAFERLYEREGRDFVRLHEQARRLAALPASERRDTLANLMQERR